MITLLKYNAGNILSVQNALNRLGYDSVVTHDKKVLEKAEKVIIPGVGEASSAMEYLKAHELDVLIPKLQQPVLGICLGLQLLCRSSEEGNALCLGVFDSEVVRCPSTEMIPHMGWNNCTELAGTLTKNIPETADFYYVHSFYATRSKHTKSICHYGIPFSATLEKDNFFATQFHPEKSASVGTILLKNFLEL